MTPTPIKRSRNLVPLSKDHHEGLLVVWKIRQGQSKQIEAQRIADFVMHAFVTHLQPHFIKEEELLFTKLAKEDQLLAKAQEQHAVLRQMATKVSQSARMPQLVAFANLLEEHIRFEERTLFQHIEQHLPPDELTAIGAALEQAHSKQKPLYWEDQFWLRK